jgi:hypothetical protein
MVVLFQLLFIFSLACGLTCTAQARVDLKKTKRLVLPIDPSEPLLSAETSQKILPKNVEQGESGNSVISEMIDNSFSLWWEKSPIKQTSIGKVADKVDKKLKTEVSFGKSADQKTEHKISVKVLAVQALAKLEYKGWVRAGLNYDARAAKTQAEVLENISAHQDLKLSHSMSSDGNMSQVSWVLNW